MSFAAAFTACVLIASSSVSSTDVPFDEYQVYEFDTARFAPNDTKPTLYTIKLVGKEDALWVEGDDYNYQWLTIVPYDGIQSVTVNRVRGNPFVKDTGSWIGKQLAKAGDVRGWFTISFTDRKGRDREIVLLAPVNGDEALASFLGDRKDIERTGAVVPVEEAPEISSVAEPAPSVPVVSALTPTPVDSQPSVAQPTPLSPAVKLLDLMTVSEFRAAGLGKLTDGELSELDAWLNRFLAKSRNRFSHGL